MAGRFIVHNMRALGGIFYVSINYQRLLFWIYRFSIAAGFRIFKFFETNDLEFTEMQTCTQVSDRCSLWVTCVEFSHHYIMHVVIETSTNAGTYNPR